ncbi:MAG: Enoyl-CoA hydratase/isomerase [Actinomycetia bacterium]|nr:Enoyl-CoA hydratase/isomerase [Actinomycetes bacterium]
MSYGSVNHLGIALGADGVLRLHLDKPAKRNAIDDDMVLALIDAIDAAGRDEAVRAIAITGAGDHFCSGFDLVGRNAAGDAAKPRVGAIQRRMPSQAHRLVPLMLTVQVPIVAAVRGWCAGIGLHLALAADFAVVADDARLWEPFAERGFTPDSGGTWVLPRRVGEVRARDMLLLGTAVSGEAAASWGMVHTSVPAPELDATADALVERLAQGPTVTLGLTKWLLHESSHRGVDEHLRDEAFALEISSRSADFREGLAAFREKRPPGFTGR